MTESCSKFEDVSQIKKKLYFDVPWLEVEKELEKAYDHLRKTAKIKGFRQGKVPRNILETYFKDNAESDAASNIIAKHYQEEMDDRKLRPAGYPNVDHQGLKKDETFSFNVTVEIEPVFEPKDYIGLELEKADPEVTEDAINKKIDKLRHFYSYMEDVSEDRGVEKGDFTSIRFEGKLDGESIKEMTSDNYFLEVGSGQFIEAFEENLMGMRREETRTFTMVFPQDYHVENIAGKEVEFTVTLKDHKIRKLPELDENFVKNFDRFNSLEELRADLTKELAVELENKSKSDLREVMMDRLIANNELEVPSIMLQHQLDQMVFEAARRWTANGIPNDKAKEMAENMRDHMKGDAERIVKAGMILKAIAEKENIAVEESEIEERIRGLAGYYAQDYEKIRKQIEDSHMMEGMENELLTKKVIEFIEGKAVITTVKKEINV
ncbi:MAG TPA: trigger factor [Syntrophales bacterium]|nr:trigger factor [Syntrophales bacterium]